MRITGPTNPFHVAKAYTPNAVTAARAPSGPERLVAAKVAGGVHFGASSASPVGSAGVYSMYAHPADRNAAATGVALGQKIDVAG
ncbi:MAG: hypothetical protein AB7G17_09140 [Phycisphaerales bacterium]